MESGLPRLNVQHLADYVIEKHRDIGISHLKLQKCLYYLQAYHLAEFDVPLFDSDFEAWANGPVCREVWNEYRDVLYVHGTQQIENLSETRQQNIKTSAALAAESMDPEQKEYIDGMIEVMLGLTGYKLKSMTHSDAPWINARKGFAPGERCSKIIPQNEMTDFYKKELQESFS